MKKLKLPILFFLVPLYFITANVNCINYDGNLIQISCSNKNSNSQILKAFLHPCSSTAHSKCISRVEIRGWLNANEKRETFLLIDEVFDLKEQIYLPLLHPYLIQVSATETIASFPLKLEEIVDVACDQNDVKRREAYEYGLNGDFVQQTAQNYNNLLNAIKEEEDAIKKDIQNFIPRSNGTSVTNEHDLLLYFDDAKDHATRLQPQVNLRNDNKNMQRQHDNNRHFESRNHEIELKSGTEQRSGSHNENFRLSPNVIAISNHHHQNNRLDFGGFSNDFEYNQMANATNQNVNSYNYLSQQKQQQQQLTPSIDNRFSINQPKIVGNAETTGVINHHHYHDLYGHDTRNQGSSDYAPNVIDVRVKIGNQQSNVDPKNLADSMQHENQFSSFRNSHSDKSTAMNYKFSFDDNRTIPIDLSIKAGGSAFSSSDDNKNDENDDAVLNMENEDNEEMNEKYLSMASSAGHHQLYSNSNKNNEIDSTEDDINSLIKNESMNDDEMHGNKNEFADSKRLRRNIDGNDSTKESMTGRKYSVYKLDAPIYGNEMKIQIFRKNSQQWIKIQPTVILTSTKKSHQDENSSIQLTERTDHSALFDRNHVRLIISNGNNHQQQSIMNIQDVKVENLNDEIKKSFCSVNEKEKRSIMSLHETGLMPSNENVITKCPTASNVERICLNLRDNDAITWRLNVVIPFQHNEILDKRLPFVKISNIFIDTSDEINMFAQFQITSMDHFTRDFNLSFTECNILERLNISKSFTLPPNKSVYVNMTMAVPFYTVQHKEQKCKVNIMAIGRNGSVIVAQRDFLISPRNKRCLCLWMCSCFCFDLFLSAEAKDLCHTMSTKNEIYAGFVDDRNYDEDDNDDDEFVSGMITKRMLMLLPVAIILVVLLMGCIKATLGCCFRQIDIWKFNHVQSCKTYRESGRCWKIFVNTLFFFLLPIVWCTKCCKIVNDEKIDSDFCIHRSVIQKETYSDDDDENDDEDVEKWKLLRPSIQSSEYSSIFEQNRRSSETIFNAANLRNPFDDNDKHSRSSSHGGYDDDEMFAKDTEFVVNAINESHESLRKLSHHSEEIIINDEQFETAEKLVKEFLAARIVYRRFNKPIGSVRVNDEQQYSVRGYFIPAQNTGYQFITYNPIKQFYEISNSNTLIAIAPQNPLDSKAFRRYYANKIEVLEANDLSLQPSTSAPCINVLVQDVSMYGK